MEKNTTSYGTFKSDSKKKLRLFGIEIDSSQIRETEKGFAENGDDHSSFDSSSSSTMTGLKKSSTRTHETWATKKFECRWCFKVLDTAQALGGHQNAHKKERMEKKWLEAQARRATGLSHYYIHIDRPFHDSFGCNGAWPLTDHEYPTESYNLDEGEQINFCTDDQFYMSSESFGQDMHGFSLTHSDGSSTSAYTYSDQICSKENLDLQLGLG